MSNAVFYFHSVITTYCSTATLAETAGGAEAKSLQILLSRFFTCLDSHFF